MAAGDQIYSFQTIPVNLGITTSLGKVSNHAQAGALVTDPVAGSKAAASAAIAGCGFQVLKDDDGLEHTIVTVR